MTIDKPKMNMVKLLAHTGELQELVKNIKSISTEMTKTIPQSKEYTDRIDTVLNQLKMKIFELNFG